MFENLIIVGGKDHGEWRTRARRAMFALSTFTPASWSGHSTPFRSPANRITGGWVGDSAKYRSGVNVWGLMTVDCEARHRLPALSARLRAMPSAATGPATISMGQASWP